MMMMLNSMREGLVVEYEGKGLLSFVSNECGGGVVVATSWSRRQLTRKTSVDVRQASQRKTKEEAM